MLTAVQWTNMISIEQILFHYFQLAQQEQSLVFSEQKCLQICCQQRIGRNYRHSGGWNVAPTYCFDVVSGLNPGGFYLLRSISHHCGM